MQRFIGILIIFCLFVFPNVVKAEPFAYISNAASESVTILDTATDTVVFTVPINASVSGIAVRPDGKRVYVTRSSGPSNVAVINTDPASVNFRKVIRIVSLTGGNAQDVIVSPDGTRAYVANSSSNHVSVIDTATNSEIDIDPIAPGIQGIGVGGGQFRAVISPDGKRLYLSRIFNGEVSVVDIDPSSLTFHTMIASVPVGTGAQPRPIGMVVTPDGAKVYVANFIDDNVSVVDTLTNTVVATVPVGDGPQGNLAVTLDGARVYVGNSFGGSVSVIDTATNQETDRIVGVRSPRGMATHPDGTRVYVANIGPDTISIIDTTTNSVVKIVTPPCTVRCGSGGNNPIEIAFATPIINQAPLADAGEDQFVEASGPSVTLVTLDASGSSDPDDNDLTFTWTGPFPEGGGTVTGEVVQVTLPIGTHTIDLLVDDGQGGTATDFLLVQVSDTTPPVLSGVSGNITVEAISSAGSVVTYAVPTATDAVDLTPSLSCLPASGITYPLGDTTVICTAMDASGNSTSESFTVRVVDTTAPETAITSAIDGFGVALTNDATTLSHDMTFAFIATDAVGVVGFECRLDAGTFSLCTSPSIFSGLPVGTHTFEVRAFDGNLNTDSTPASLTWTILTSEQATQEVADELNSIIDANLGTPLADKLEDAQAKLQDVLAELTKTPPDNQAAVGNLEGAVGELEAAVNDGLLDSGQGNQLMDQLTEIARMLAVDAIDEAIAQGGDAGEIGDAQQAVAEGDALRASGAFKDAVNKYKDALGKAEGALP